ncbi:hypothetical protein [Rhizobium leguminosarum]|uniref:hypothetical protein n=1 Tax=Rhizobium leguminosarum TaxID=384 RepID=UPI0013BCD6F4|nr:hypothetical protein [Rhizobium leguminosarum]NEI62181.1 hypothetical protein [Rhizobium leguminosarum]
MRERPPRDFPEPRPLKLEELAKYGVEGVLLDLTELTTQPLKHKIKDSTYGRPHDDPNDASKGE